MGRQPTWESECMSPEIYFQSESSLLPLTLLNKFEIDIVKEN